MKRTLQIMTIMMKTILLDENYVLFDKQTLLSYRHHRDHSLKEVVTNTIENFQQKCIALLSPKSLRRSRSICSSSAPDGIRAALMGPCHKSTGRNKFSGPEILMERKNSIKGMTR